MAVNSKSIDSMMLDKALEDIADGMSYLSASNVYNISVNELKSQFLQKYMVHVKPAKAETEECVLSGNELKPDQMEYFIRYISQTLLGTAKDVKDNFLKETQQWDLDSTQRKTLWKNLRTTTESSMQKLLENGDCPERNLSDTLWQCFDYYMVHNMPLYQKLFGSYGDNPKQMRALIHLFNLVGKHRVEYLNDAPVPVRIKCWINVGLDYMKKGHVCSLMLLQRRWHEMKMCARMYFLEYWSVFRRIRDNSGGQETLHRPKFLHINIAVKYPHVMLKELQSWTRTRKEGGVITMDQFDKDETYQKMKETFKAIRKTVINFKDVVKEKQQSPSRLNIAPKSELIIRPIKKTSDSNGEDDEVVMIEDDLPIKPFDDLRGIVIENIMSSGDNTITVKIPKVETESRSAEKIYNVETVVKSESRDDITIENEGPEGEKDDDTGIADCITTEKVSGEFPEIPIKCEPENKVDDFQAKRIKSEKIDDENDEVNEICDVNVEDRNETHRNRDETDKNNVEMEEPVEYDADFLKNLEREHNRLASDDEGEDKTCDDNSNGSVGCEDAENEDIVNRVKIDDDIEIIEQKRETIVIEDEIESSKWNYIKNMEKSTKKVYSPLAVCKNPDFNRRLQRFTASFMIIPRNRSLLGQCKPCTIDLVNYQAMPVPQNRIPETDSVKPSGSGTINNLPQEVRVKQEKASPEKLDSSETGKRIMPSRQSKFRSMTVPYPAPKRGTKPLPKSAPKTTERSTPKPLQRIPPKPQTQPVMLLPLVNNDSIVEKKITMCVNSKGQPFVRSAETKNMRSLVSVSNMKKVITPSRPWWYQSPNTERDFGETTLGMDTLEEILESLSDKPDKTCKPKPMVNKKHRTEHPCCYVRKDIIRSERRFTNKQTAKVVHLHSRENCSCCCKEIAEKLDSNLFVFLELAPSIHPALEGLTVEMVSANPDPTDEVENVERVTANIIASEDTSREEKETNVPEKETSPEKTGDEQDVDVCKNNECVPTVQVTSVKNRGASRRGRAKNVASRGGSLRNTTLRGSSGAVAVRGSFANNSKTPLTLVSVVEDVHPESSKYKTNLPKQQYSKNPPPLIYYPNSKNYESIATVSLGPSPVEPFYEFVVLGPVNEVGETNVRNNQSPPDASETDTENLDRPKKSVETRLDEELNSDDDIVSTSDDETYNSKRKRKSKKSNGDENSVCTISKNMNGINADDIPATVDVEMLVGENKRNVLQDLLDKSGISFEDGLDSDVNVSQITSTKGLRIEVSPFTSNIEERTNLNVGDSILKRRSVGCRKIEQKYALGNSDTIDLTETETNEDTATNDASENSQQKILPKVFISSKDLRQMGLKPGVISTKVLLQKGLPVTKKDLNRESSMNTNLPNILRRNGFLVAKDNSRIVSPVKDSAGEMAVDPLPPTTYISVNTATTSPVEGKMVFVKPALGRKRRRPKQYRINDKKPDTIISLVDDDTTPMVEEYLDDTLEAESSDDESLASLAKRKKDDKTKKVSTSGQKSPSDADENSQSSIDSDVFKDPVSINLESDESSQSSKISNENCMTSVKSPQIYMEEGETSRGDDLLLIVTPKESMTGSLSKNTSEITEKPRDVPESAHNTDVSSRNTFGTNDTIYSYIVMSPGSPQYDDEIEENTQNLELPSSEKYQENINTLLNTDENSQSSVEISKSTELVRNSTEDFESALPCHLVQNTESKSAIPNINTLLDTDENSQSSVEISKSTELVRNSPEDFESALPCHLVQNTESKSAIPNGSIIDI